MILSEEMFQVGEGWDQDSERSGQWGKKKGSERHKIAKNKCRIHCLGIIP